MSPQDKALIHRFLPELMPTQWGQLEMLPSLYQWWNNKVNIVSRKDIDNIVERHILHSVAISFFCDFAPGTKVIDVGTGGGLPGIPLAILYPECHFVLIDSIGKKIKVVQSIIDRLQLTNARAIQIRAEQFTDERADFVVSRAAMSMDKLVDIGKILVDTKRQNNQLRNGIIALKGGDLSQELQAFQPKVKVRDISDFLPEMPFYETKKIVYYPL